MAARGLPKHRAEALAARLDIGLDCGICLLCLSLVSDRLRTGTVHEIRGGLCAMTPTLWDEGLEPAAVAAVREAAAADVPDADAALLELEARGGRSGVARAIVRQLALRLTREAQTELRLMDFARDRLSVASPEWN